jgi:hypothetical protein
MEPILKWTFSEQSPEATDTSLVDGLGDGIATLSDDDVTPGFMSHFIPLGSIEHIDKKRPNQPSLWIFGLHFPLQMDSDVLLPMLQSPQLAMFKFHHQSPKVTPC